jgi:hypothetical protein
MNNGITNYPLCWPDNVPRTAPHMRGNPHFQPYTVAGAVQMVVAEINRLNKRDWLYQDNSVIVSTNIKPTLAGLPASNQSEPTDTGVAIYFTLRFCRNSKWYERPTVLTCDKWRKTSDNIKAIAKDIEAQRARHRWGCTSVEQAFQGYLAIPEKCGGPSWWVMLGIDSRSTKDQIKNRYRDLAKTKHPDIGGDPKEWRFLQEAYNQAMAA